MIQTEAGGDMAAKHKWTFFGIAAWASLVVPLVTLVVTVALSSLSGNVSCLPPPSRQFTGDLHGWALLADLAGLVLGAVSLFGIKWHGLAYIYWKAVPGIIASGIFGFYNFFVMMASSIIC